MRNLAGAAVMVLSSGEGCARGQGNAGLSLGILAVLAVFGALYWVRKTYPQLGPALLGLVVAAAVSALAEEGLEALGLVSREHAGIAMLAILLAIYATPLALLWMGARRRPGAPTGR